MGNKFLRHGLCQSRINNSHIRGDFKVCDGILNSLLIVRDNGKCSYLCCRSGSRGNRAELCLISKCRDAKDLTHIFKGAIRILILNPHCLSRINRRTSADGNNPIRSEVLHLLRALHYGIYRRIGLNPFKKLYFHTCFLQVLYYFVQKTETLHRSAAHADKSLLSFKSLQCL